MTRTLLSAGFLLLSLASLPASAQEKFSGFLCCNMHSDGKEISDANIDDSDQHLVPLGTPLNVTGYGRHRVKVFLENTNQAIVNDYSRDVSMQDFAKRYIVADDPKIALKSYPKNIQNAIASGHLVKGMTRQQVIMSLGYPTGTDNPGNGGKSWVFWLADRAQGEKVQYRVKFDDNDRLSDIENLIDAKARLLTE
jgi:hypothetical protein